MHDEQHWLKYPVLPRPPALPRFGRELCALLGLDPSDFESDLTPNGGEPITDSARAECGDTRPDSLATSELRVHAGVIRTGT